MFKPPCSLGLQVAPTDVTFSGYMAARPFTPRIDHVVTLHELWYRYMPESGNWHDGTFTRWIGALSAAPVAFIRFRIPTTKIQGPVLCPSLIGNLNPGFPFAECEMCNAQIHNPSADK
jgi:hypothetical protein